MALRNPSGQSQTEIEVDFDLRSIEERYFFDAALVAGVADFDVGLVAGVADFDAAGAAATAVVGATGGTGRGGSGLQMNSTTKGFTSR
jgi:hypothetical protein